MVLALVLPLVEIAVISSFSVAQSSSYSAITFFNMYAHDLPFRRATSKSSCSENDGMKSTFLKLIRI